MRFSGERMDDFTGEGGLPDCVLEVRFGEPMLSDGMEREVLRRFAGTRTESEKGRAARFVVL
jgi:hypothetical protein